MQRKCKIWQNGYPQTRVVESFKYCIMNITPVNIAVCNQKGSVQQNAGDGNPQGSPSGDSHGLADSHLRCLIPGGKRAGLNLRLEFIRPLLFSESEIGTVRQFGPLFGLSHYLLSGWSPWHKSESWSYICAPTFLIPFPAEYRSSA